MSTKVNDMSSTEWADGDKEEGGEGGEVRGRTQIPQVIRNA